MTPDQPLRPPVRNGEDERPARLQEFLRKGFGVLQMLEDLQAEHKIKHGSRIVCHEIGADRFQAQGRRNVLDIQRNPPWNPGQLVDDLSDIRTDVDRLRGGGCVFTGKINNSLIVFHFLAVFPIQRTGMSILPGSIAPAFPGRPQELVNPLFEPNEERIVFNRARKEFFNHVFFQRTERVGLIDMVGGSRDKL